jgi:GT2 family glycosyltransferase
MPDPISIEQWAGFAAEAKLGYTDKMVTLIIPVFNKSELTKRCLNSVLENSRRVQAVVVIDNASSDDTQTVLAGFAPLFAVKRMDYQVVQNEKNLGFGAACNQGVRLAKSDYIAILNNDTWVMFGWDEALLEAIRVKKLQVVGPFYDEEPWTDSMKERARTFLTKNKEQYRTHFVPILMLFTQNAIERLRFSHGGIFDERFFVTYEDTDLLVRINQLGMRYAQTSLCYIWHQSMGTRSQVGLLPEGYEADGLRIFMEKWGYDPRPADHTFIERFKRKRRKARAAKGLF